MPDGCPIRFFLFCDLAGPHFCHCRQGNRSGGSANFSFCLDPIKNKRSRPVRIAHPPYRSLSRAAQLAAPKQPAAPGGRPRGAGPCASERADPPKDSAGFMRGRPLGYFCGDGQITCPTTAGKGENDLTCRTPSRFRAKCIIFAGNRVVCRADGPSARRGRQVVIR